VVTQFMSPGARDGVQCRRSPGLRAAYAALRCSRVRCHSWLAWLFCTRTLLVGLIRPSPDPSLRCTAVNELGSAGEHSLLGAVKPVVLCDDMGHPPHRSSPLSPYLQMDE